jgi:hypothetical protein
VEFVPKIEVREALAEALEASAQAHGAAAAQHRDGIERVRALRVSGRWLEQERRAQRAEGIDFEGDSAYAGQLEGLGREIEEHQAVLSQTLLPALEAACEAYRVARERAGRELSLQFSERAAAVRARIEELREEIVWLTQFEQRLRTADAEAVHLAFRSDERPPVEGTPAELRQRILDPAPGEWFDAATLDDLDLLEDCLGEDPVGEIVLRLHPRTLELSATFDGVPDPVRRRVETVCRLTADRAAEQRRFRSRARAG